MRHAPSGHYGANYCNAPVISSLYVRFTLVSGRNIGGVRTSAPVKGCRTPAVAVSVRQAGTAGVGQASGEETAERSGLVVRLARPMGIEGRMMDYERRDSGLTMTVWGAGATGRLLYGAVAPALIN